MDRHIPNLSGDSNDGEQDYEGNVGDCTPNGNNQDNDDEFANDLSTGKEVNEERGADFRFVQTSGLNSNDHVGVDPHFYSTHLVAANPLPAIVDSFPVANVHPIPTASAIVKQPTVFPAASLPGVDVDLVGGVDGDQFVSYSHTPGFGQCFRPSY